MFTIAPVYVVAAIAGAVQSAPSGDSHELTGHEVLDAYEREIQARRLTTLAGPDAASLLAGAALLRASLPAERLDEIAPPQAA